MESASNEKIIALYKYLRELSSLRLKSVRNISDQEWVLPMDRVPADNIGVSITYRDAVDDGEMQDAPIIEVNKPEFQACPDPGDMFAEWLKDGWNYFKNEARVFPVREVVDASSGKTRTEHFEDNGARVASFGEWSKLRARWVAKQREIDETRKLFVELYKVHVDLDRDPETFELMLGVGSLKDRRDQSFDHPVLLKKALTEFDSLSNTIRVVESDEASELYSLPLREMEGLNLDRVQQFEAELAEKDYHPFDRLEARDFLKAFVHTLTPSSEFVNGLHDTSNAPDVRLVMYMRPVVFVRRRIDGTVKAIDRIIECVEDGGEVPAYLRDIVDGGVIDSLPDYEEPCVEEKLAAIGGESIDILLSKEANREQLDIARRIEMYNAVLVQGPPGTGKTHTIANLVGHFLAQGKSVLVTSQTRKALSVLKEKVPEGLQNLCVSVLDDSNADMERSVDGITDYLSHHSSAELRRDADRAAVRRETIIGELAEARRNIFNVLHKEYESIIYQGEGYSPLDAAIFVGAQSDELGSLIPGPVVHMAPPPLSASELDMLYRSNEALSVEDERETAKEVPSPDLISSPVEFSDLVEALKLHEATVAEICARKGWSLIPHISGDSFVVARGAAGDVAITPSSKPAIAGLRDYVSTRGGVDGWRVKAAADGLKGGSYRMRWEAMFEQVEKTCAISDRLVVTALGKEIAVSSEQNAKSMRDELLKLKDVFERKGKIGRFDLWMNRGFEEILTHVTIDGSPIASSDDCALVADWIALGEERDKCRSLWQRLMSENGAPEFDDLGSREPERMALKWVEDAKRLLDWHAEGLSEYRGMLASAGIQGDVLLAENKFETEEGNIRRLLTVMVEDVPVLCDLAIAFIDASSVKEVLANNVSVLRDGRRSESQICMGLASAIADRDPVAHEVWYAQLSSLYSKQGLIRERRALIEKIREVAPRWADAIESREGLHGLQSPPEQIMEAWKWMQLNAALDDTDAVSLRDLQRLAFDLGREYRRTTAELAEKRAWLALLERTERDISLKQSLQGWKQTVKKIGKGTGKRAPMMKARARELMAQCQAAVPAWIMPMGRALESLDPRSNRFDVVIVDEASQSDVSALAITYLGRKTIIVGDDKQVSPMAVGVEEDKTSALADMYIKGVIPNYHLYGPKTSLYDIAKTTFQELMLKEHFRCMPEIIGFSNMLSYDFKIKPLRDPGSSNIMPPVVSHRVEGGERSGKTNRREAEDIVRLIQACMKQPEYDGKTFGVISLLGDEQVKLLQSLIFENIDTRDIEARRILCGNASHFQGDERDIVFLSLVDSNDGEGPLRLLGFGAGDAYRKRYNVASSRAKDQLWVVHSLDPGNDLKGDDLRRRLIDYVADPNAFYGKLEEAEARAESPFEEEVAKALIARGFGITQQWEVGAYRIDIVAIDGNKRVAIECDGERWHGDEEAIRRDMERQAVLERLGWRFVRVRGSEYYRDQAGAIERVVSELKALGVEPTGALVAPRDTELLDRVRAAASELNHVEGEVIQSAESRYATIEDALGSGEQLRFGGQTSATIFAEDNTEEQSSFKHSAKERALRENIGKLSEKPKANPKTSLKTSVGLGDEHKAKNLDGSKRQKNADKKQGRKSANPKPSTAAKKAPRNKDASKQIQMVLPVDADASSAAEQYDAFDPIVRDLMMHGIECVDRRAKGGALWAIGGREIDFTLKDIAKKYEVKFEYLPKGGNASKGSPAYYMMGKPKLPKGESAPSISTPKPSPKNEGKKAKAVVYREAYKLAELPFTPLSNAEDYDHGTYKEAIRKRMATVIEVESPIEQQRLFNRVRESFGVKRSGSYIQAHNERILRSIEHEVTRFNCSAFVWKPGQNPESYTKYRPNENGVNRSVKELPLEEILAAMTEVLARSKGVDKATLIEKAAKRFGYKRIASRIIEVFDAALKEGLKRGRFVKGKNGTILLP